MEPGAHSGMRARRGVVTLGVITALFMIGHGGPAHAAASTEDCVAKRVADGEPRAQALATCLREAADEPASGGGGLDTSPDNERQTDSNSDDTSPLVLVGVGVGGVVIGAAGALLLGRRSSKSAPAVGSGMAPASATVPPPPVLQVPTFSPSPASDRSPALVAALVDLSDRMSSQALRAEIIATLERVGVHAVDIAVGTPFEAASMRGVGSAPTSDATWVGRVAATDRCGFHDGGRLIRLPDVVVYTAG
jgi:hypothetical protein